jgi:endo-1,4-beta-xylanase
MKVSTILVLVASATTAFADLSLKEAANGFSIGVAANTRFFEEEGYLEATNQYNTMVAENGCKLSGIQAEQGVYDFTDCDAHLAKAEELGMKFRGHCLIWFNYQPEWFQNIKGYDNMKNAIVDHITTVLTHYKGKIDTWDIVNEAVDDWSSGENGTFQLRDNFLTRECPDYIDIAFKTAREVDPEVKLYYNDYNNEGLYGSKTDSVYNLVKDMVDRGVPIDGVGLQYHLHTNAYPEYEKVVETMRRYAELGLEVQITEMDVNSVEGKTEEAFALQAKLYGEGLRACLNSPNCTGFITWGVGDSNSWRSNGYPLAFDVNYAPKPAYYAMLNVLKEYNNVEESDDQADEVDDADTTVDADVDSAEEDSADEQN